MARRGLDTLGQVPLFAQVSRRHLRKIFDVTEEYTFAEGSTLAKEGSPGEAFFVIIEGEAKVVRGGKTIARLLPGDFFGEISLLDGGPRSATVIAATPMRCLLLLGKEFRDLLAREPQVTVKVMREVAHRIRHAERPLRG